MSAIFSHIALKCTLLAYLINLFTLTAWGSTLDVRFDIYRHQIQTSKVDPCTVRVKLWVGLKISYPLPAPYNALFSAALLTTALCFGSIHILIAVPDL